MFLSDGEGPSSQDNEPLRATRCEMTAGSICPELRVTPPRLKSPRSDKEDGLAAYGKASRAEPSSQSLPVKAEWPA
jgi:hypothetical protein